MLSGRLRLALILGMTLLVGGAHVFSQQPPQNKQHTTSHEVTRLIQLLDDPNPTVRKQAVIALSEISNSIHKSLQAHLTDENAEVRSAVAEALDHKDAKATTPKNSTLPTEVCQSCKGARNVQTKCERCRGTGDEKCLNCNGTGKTINILDKEVACYKCNGAGKNTCTYFQCKGTGTYEDRCAKCKGVGYTIRLFSQ